MLKLLRGLRNFSEKGSKFSQMETIQSSKVQSNVNLNIQLARCESINEILQMISQESKKLDISQYAFALRVIGRNLKKREGPKRTSDLINDERFQFIKSKICDSINDLNQQEISDACFFLKRIKQMFDNISAIITRTHQLHEMKKLNLSNAIQICFDLKYLGKQIFKLEDMISQQLQQNNEKINIQDISQIIQAQYQGDIHPTLIRVLIEKINEYDLNTLDINTLIQLYLGFIKINQTHRISFTWSMIVKLKDQISNMFLKGKINEGEIDITIFFSDILLLCNLTTVQRSFYQKLLQDYLKKMNSLSSFENQEISQIIEQLHYLKDLYKNEYNISIPLVQRMIDHVFSKMQEFMKVLETFKHGLNSQTIALIEEKIKKKDEPGVVLFAQSLNYYTKIQSDKEAKNKFIQEVVNTNLKHLLEEVIQSNKILTQIDLACIFVSFQDVECELIQSYINRITENVQSFLQAKEFENVRKIYSQLDNYPPEVLAKIQPICSQLLRIIDEN